MPNSKDELRDAQEAYRAELERITGLDWVFETDPANGCHVAVWTWQTEWFAHLTTDLGGQIGDTAPWMPAETVSVVFGIQGSRTVDGKRCDHADDRLCDTVRGVFASLVTLCNIHAVARPEVWA